MTRTALACDNNPAPWRKGDFGKIGRSRQARGRVADLSGRFAEENVALFMERRGLRVVHRRWRGTSGEIDLICRQDGCLVFVEVKKSRTHAEAAERLHRGQQIRICNAAQEYCATQPAGMACEMRFDVALVDALGRVDVMENAFGDCFA